MLISSHLSCGLELTSSFASSALIIRHSIRESIPADQTGNNVPLTAEGRKLAELFGKSIASRLASITSSPIGRCTETSEHILKGAKCRIEVPTSRTLGDPGIFIADEQAAWTNFQTLGTKGVMMHISRKNEILPGMNDPLSAAHSLLQIMMEKCRDSGLHIFVTHDVILAGIVGQLINGVNSEEDLPGFLEGAFFWRDGQNIYGSYRSRAAIVSPRN